jgi:DNA repair protein RecO (recombination protein O)
MVRSIIFEKRDRGEADELVLFMSRELGWLRGIAKNSKKSRVRFGGHLEPLSLVDFTLRQRHRDNLVWIDESHVIDGFLGIRADIAKVALASYYLEIASLVMLEDNPDAGVFDFLSNMLSNLESSEIVPLRQQLDEIRLLGLLGYAPGFGSCPVCHDAIDPGQEALFSLSNGSACHAGCLSPEETSFPLSPDTLAVIRQGLKISSNAVTRLRHHKNGIRELRALLSGYVRYTVGREIRSLVFLEKMAPRGGAGS